MIQDSVTQIEWIFKGLPIPSIVVSTGSWTNATPEISTEAAADGTLNVSKDYKKAMNIAKISVYNNSAAIAFINNVFDDATGPLMGYTDTMSFTAPLAKAITKTEINFDVNGNIELEWHIPRDTAAITNF